MATHKTPTPPPQAIRTVSASALTATSSTLSAAQSSTRTSPSAKLLALWATPAAFAVVFGCAFCVAFAGGALALWRSHDPQELLAAGRIEDALLVIDSTPSPSAKWLLVKGKAIQRRGELQPMLLAYQDAVEGGASDDESLKHTLEALGDERVASLAIKTLEDWPGKEELDATLLGLASDSSRLRRHKAVEALEARKKSAPALRLEAAIKLAISDVRGEDCGDALAAVKALTAWSSDPAAEPFLKKHRAFDAIFSIDNDATMYRQKCLDRDAVKRASSALASGAR